MKAAPLATQKSLSLGVSSEVGGLSCDNFGSLEGSSSGYCWECDGGWGGQYGGGGSNNRSYGCSWNRGTDREVSGRNSETVDGVRDVAGALDESVAVDVGVASAGDAVSSSSLGLGAGAACISVAVLSQRVLSVVLAGYGSGDAHRGNCCVGQGTHYARLRGGQSHHTGDDYLYRHF